VLRTLCVQCCRDLNIIANAAAFARVQRAR